MKTQYFLHSIKYPIRDHVKTFAQKPIGKRGRAKLSQTFMVSRPYQGPHLTITMFNDYIDKCKQHNLQMIYEETLFRNIQAWLIIIAHCDVNLNHALKFARQLEN